MKQAEIEIQEAINLDTNNAKAYYISGLIFSYKGDYSKAISDAEKSISLEKCKEEAYQLKIDSHIYKFGIEGGGLPEMIKPLQESIEILELGMKECGDSFTKIFQTKLDDLKIFHQYFLTYLPDDDASIVPLQIVKNSRASYTDSARQGNIEGTITLAIFFSANGETKKALALNSLGKGLVEQAVDAAQKIEFNPEIRDGKPVSVVKKIQYTFTLY